MRSDTLLSLAINRLSFLKANEKSILEDIVNTAAFYQSLGPSTLSQIIGRKLRTTDVRTADTLQVAERDYLFCQSHGVKILHIWDEEYPAQLREIFDPPFLLFVRGRLPDPDKPCIAVVGTREPGAAAVLAAERLCGDIAASGHWVISGLARGIDIAAHRGAVHRGLTGAVLGCGIDAVTPPSHRTFAAKLLDAGGFLVSEYSPGIPAAKYHFPARNRIISGLSRGVVVVEAPARSGALITAEYALDQGRDLFVHRSGLEGRAGAGARELADDGARIITGASDIFEEWGVPLKPADPEHHQSDAATGREAARLLADELRAVLSPEVSNG